VIEGLENKLYNLANSYWELQENNYDIEYNHKDLLNFNFTDLDLSEKLEEITKQCEEISRVNPPSDPKIDRIFRNAIAPIPNNSVIAVVARAIMIGGRDFDQKTGGWQEQGDDLTYEIAYEKAGTVTITIVDCPDQTEFVRSLSLLTLDVLAAVIGHLCFAHCKKPNDNPLSAKAIVTAKQILRYKDVKSYGRKRWVLIEKIDREIVKLSKIRISVQATRTRKGTESYEGHLAIIKPVKRDFNPFTKDYVSSSWEILPGNWAVFNMSKTQYNYIGKLSQVVLAYEHRDQRGAQLYAKKLMYSLFIIPGGTFYLEKGVKKYFRDYLELMGEHYAVENSGRNRCHRSLSRLADAMDFLIDQGMITTNINGSVSNYINSIRGARRIEKLLDTQVEIKMIGIT